MNVHPVFVPVDGAHVAATICLPDGRARGLAVLLQGFGAMRSHRNRLWTRTSADLAARGIASVRLDYPGLGDSTGTRVHSMRQPPVRAVTAAIKVALDAAGVDSYCVVGNCLGARTALLIAERMPCCVGVGLILPEDLHSIVREEPSRVGSSAFKQVVRTIRPLRRLAHLVANRAARRSIRLMPEIEALMDEVRMLFLFIGTGETWRRLESVLDARSPGNASRDRFERVFVPASGSRGLQPLSSQEAVLRVIPDWVDRVVSGFASRPERAAAHGITGGLSVHETGVSVHMDESLRTSNP
jgi:pimeloyl-ACP methyl ester carboxylesterase